MMFSLSRATDHFSGLFQVNGPVYLLESLVESWFDNTGTMEETDFSIKPQEESGLVSNLHMEF